MENQCPDCKHTLVDNIHGPDQNDYVFNKISTGFKHCGSCTYCIYCNPRLREAKERNKNVHP